MGSCKFAVAFLIASAISIASGEMCSGESSSGTTVFCSFNEYCCGDYYSRYCCSNDPYVPVGPSGGTIAGSVIGSLILFAIIIGIIVCCVRGCCGTNTTTIVQRSQPVQVAPPMTVPYQGQVQPVPYAHQGAPMAPGSGYPPPQYQNQNQYNAPPPPYNPEMQRY